MRFIKTRTSNTALHTRLERPYTAILSKSNHGRIPGLFVMGFIRINDIIPKIYSAFNFRSIKRSICLKLLERVHSFKIFKYHLYRIYKLKQMYTDLRFDIDRVNLNVEKELSNNKWQIGYGVVFFQVA